MCKLWNKNKHVFISWNLFSFFILKVVKYTRTSQNKANGDNAVKLVQNFTAGYLNNSNRYHSISSYQLSIQSGTAKSNQKTEHYKTYQNRILNKAEIIITKQNSENNNCLQRDGRRKSPYLLYYIPSSSQEILRPLLIRGGWDVWFSAHSQ